MFADSDLMEYNNLLRNGILDAYSGIIQGMGPAKAEHYLKGELSDMLLFVASIGAESEPDEDVARSAVNLLGDICSVFVVSWVIGMRTILSLSAQRFRFMRSQMTSLAQLRERATIYGMLGKNGRN